MGLISLALIDDHPIVIEGLTHVLRSLGAFKVVATGGSSQGALAIAETYQPELMVLDLQHPGSTVAAVAEIKAKYPTVKIIVFTAERSVEHAMKAIEAGARGYVSKSCSVDELLLAARTAATGGTYISQNFASGFVKVLRDATARKIVIPAPKLSAREDQIIRLLLDGRTNREIASDLGITERTVKHYMTLLMQKLNVRNRVEVVIAAQNLNRDLIASLGFRTNGSHSRDQRYVTGAESYHS